MLEAIADSAEKYQKSCIVGDGMAKTDAPQPHGLAGLAIMW